MASGKLLTREIGSFGSLAGGLASQARITRALMMREMVTRYGREGLGFLWVVGEPLLFCLGVIVMWSVLKPAYEHGVRVGAFVMTGYMCLLLLRHFIQHSLGAIQANIGLLHHRQVSIIHVYVARALVEFMGTTTAFLAVFVILFLIGQVSFPKNPLLLYWGWISLAWLSFGLALLLSALAVRFEVVERITQLFTYMLIPLSGAFFTVSIVPAAYREAFLLVPMPNAVEMVRAGFFGEFFEAYYHPTYPALFGTVLLFFALIVLSSALKYVDVE
jgi:capsular polysaccharide transport system permease protein